MRKIKNLVKICVICDYKKSYQKAKAVQILSNNAQLKT